MKPSLLIVDDDEEIRTQMKWALGKDYEITVAEDRADAVQQFRATRPPVVLLDLGLPPRPNSCEEGFDVLEQLLALDAATKIIIVSGQEEKANALRAIGAGAWDFLCKPVNIDELRLLLRRVFFVSGLEKSWHRQQQLDSRAEVFEGMIGSSKVMLDVFAMIRKVAPSSAPVLILGESGTGKEMAASGIHARSTRKAGPFVAINCNAIPENLIESELFGHEKGTFTGAHARREGLIESAAGGTLFLDEIGDLAPAIQVKLLRFLQEKTLQRVGGREEIAVDTRVVAATHVDLEQAVAQGKFREDLYFRLAVVVIQLPPLRAREDDIACIARELLHRYASLEGRTGLALTPDALRALNRHGWSGNIRELQNRLRRAVIMAERNRITAEDLELEDPAAPETAATLKEAREAVEREMVQRALAKHAGKIAPAAIELGISRPTFYELMEKLNIERAV